MDKKIKSKTTFRGETISEKTGLLIHSQNWWKITLYREGNKIIEDEILYSFCEGQENKKIYTKRNSEYQRLNKKLLDAGL